MSGVMCSIATLLVGWGLMDIPGFANNPARLTYIVLVLFLNAFAAIRIPEIGKSRMPEKTAVARQHAAVVLLQITSVAIVFLGPWSDRRNVASMSDAETLRYIGLGLYIVGFLLMHFAEAQLGRLFSTEVSILAEHTLVTDGLYRHVRHPRYAGIILSSVGLALVFRSWLALILAGTDTLVLFWRIGGEGQLMRREFGGRWEGYVRRSWRLLPYVYQARSTDGGLSYPSELSTCASDWSLPVRRTCASTR